MTNPRFSRFWQTTSRNGARAAAAALTLLALAASAASVEDDYRQGERAYRAGDLVVASTSLRRSAEAGHAPSQVLFASLLEQSRFDEEAVQWYRKAAEQGNADGQYGLGTAYLSGEGVGANLPEAYRWLSRAADSGHEQSLVALANASIRADRGEITPGPDPARASEWLRKAAAFDHLASLDALALAYQSGGFGLSPDAARSREYGERAAAIRKKMTVERGRKKK